jgi:hypothetical protein
MSLCKICLKNIENCQCPIDITEPRLEVELAIADNIMAVGNPSIQQSCEIIDAKSPSDSFSLLMEMEEREKYGTLIKNNVYNDDSIPKLQRQFTNINLNEEDVEDIIPDDSICLPVLERQYTTTFTEDDIKEALIADANFSQCIDDYDDDFVFETIDNCEECQEFICICDNLIKCTIPNCNNYYYSNYAEPSYEMCYSCEMNERRQELIDELLYPDDIPMELRYNSDRNSF